MMTVLSSKYYDSCREREQLRNTWKRDEEDEMWSVGFTYRWRWQHKMELMETWRQEICSSDQEQVKSNMCKYKLYQLIKTATECKTKITESE